ncbi:MAG: hypothetical protein PHO48_02075 [Candidatus Gracilibacteria bacterium]|nr:hypothetical protein [Candidatus Gracilibacteria bacterium]MDD5178843.1 hypothetical protein [Candidatus Gracilibacteria bacterium]
MPEAPEPESELDPPSEDSEPLDKMEILEGIERSFDSIAWLIGSMISTEIVARFIGAIRKEIEAVEICGVQIDGDFLMCDIAYLEKELFTRIVKPYIMDGKDFDAGKKWSKQEARELFARIYPDFKDNTGIQRMVYDPASISYKCIQDSIWDEPNDAKDSPASWIA